MRESLITLGDVEQCLSLLGRCNGLAEQPNTASSRPILFSSVRDRRLYYIAGNFLNY